MLRKVITSIAGMVMLALLLNACSGQNPALGRIAADNQSWDIAEINVQLAMAYLQKRDLPRAKQKLLLAQAQAPKDPVVWYATGYFMETIGEVTAAQQAYLKALAIAPNDGAAHDNYGTFLCRHRQYTKAVQQFIIAINDPQYLNTADAYENAGLCALKIPNMAKAEQYFLMALAQNPDLATSLLKMAAINYKQGRMDQARVYLQRYTKVARPNAESLALQSRLSR